MDHKGSYDFREGPNNNPTSLIEKLGVAGCILATPLLIAAWTVAYPFKPYRQLPLKDQLFANIEGYFTKSLNYKQLRMLVPIQPVREVFKGFERKAKRIGLENFNGYFGSGDDNFSARWIHEVTDRTPNDPVMIYMHGGGYALKVSTVQVGYMLKFAQHYAKKRVSIVCLDYTVVPFERFPGQLREAVAVYKELSETCNSISIVGDSCGCHLAIQMCSHSADPVTGVEPVNVDFYSLIFFSPWCGLDVSVGGSYDVWGSRDIIDKQSSKSMQEMYCNDDLLHDHAVNPVIETNSEYWKKVLPAKVVVVYGEYEILGDGIKEWCASASIASVFEQPAGVHDAMLLSYDSPSTRFVLEVVDQWF